jgi:hypothetical protein
LAYNLDEIPFQWKMQLAFLSFKRSA